MKKIFLIISVILLTLLKVLGQDEVVILKNKISGKEKIIREGKLIKVTSIDGRISKGRLAIINDSDILIGSDTLGIDKLVELGTKFSLSLIVGVLLFSYGLISTYVGVAAIVSATGDMAGLAYYLGTLEILQGLIVGTAGIFIESMWIKYKKDQFDFYISKITPKCK